MGLLPAAGQGSRLGPIPCSKEIMPLGFQMQATPSGPRWQPVTALETHLHALQLAGATRAALIIRDIKYDIVRYIGDGATYGLAISYLYQHQPRGMPFALDLAAPWIGTAHTLFSMPDTLLTPPDTSARVAATHRDQQPDVTLGLFPTTTPHKFGMVAFDAAGQICGFVDKPTQTNLHLMWGLAAWSPRFTHFLAAYLQDLLPSDRECVLSDVFAAALAADLSFTGVVLEQARYRDIGTPEDFQLVVYELAHEQAERIYTPNNPLTQKY